MTNRNYNCPVVDPRWSDCRETHPAVAMAIHAISDSQRLPDAIWENPTVAEWGHVAMAVDEYITHGVFSADASGRYNWGCETIVIANDDESERSA